MRVRKIFLSAAALMILSGCALALLDKRPPAYHPVSNRDVSFGAYSLAIAPVADQRPMQNKQNNGMFFIADFLAPIIPYVDFLEYERLDEKLTTAPDLVSQAYKAAGIPALLQQDLVQEFRHAGIFDSGAPLGPGEKPHFVLQPTLLSAKYTQRAYPYLPVVGFLLVPAFGPPMTQDRLFLKMQLDLYVAGINEPVWTFNIAEATTGHSNLYWYLTGPDKNLNPVRSPQIQHDLLAEGLKRAIPALKDFLRQQPKTFWEQVQAGGVGKGKPLEEGRDESVEDILKEILKEK